MRDRIEWIDLAKGYTILLVVIGHVLLGLLNSNRFSEHTESLSFIIGVIYSFHMPVFFILSGYTYGYKKNETFRDYGKSISKKFLSLSVPYVVFSIIMFLLKYIGQSEVRNGISIEHLLNIYKAPIDFLWFLYTLFFIFVIAELLDLFIKNEKVVFLFFIIGFIVFNIFPTDVYFIQRTMIWGVFFYFGKILSSKSHILNSNKLFTFNSIAFICYVIIWSLISNLEKTNYDALGILGTCGAVFGSMMVLSLFNKVKSGKLYSYFVKVGLISLPIYLLHNAIASVTRIMLLKIGITSFVLHLCIGLVVAWFGSLILFGIIKRIWKFDLIFYPNKYVKY